MVRAQLPSRLRQWAIQLFFIFLLISGLFLLFTAFIYTSTPSGIRHPQLDHYHFRMQVVTNGLAQNFADSKYQTDYAKDSCSEDLPTKPIHFHDNKNQVVHVHWRGMTGGLVLKNYGWNLTGGSNDSLGYRFDDLLAIRQVPIHGKSFPDLAPDSKLYIYSGDEKEYRQRNLEDFKAQNLEDFLGKASNLTARTAYIPLISDLLPATAHAHEGHKHTEEKSSEELSRINNLLGNVVIFAQKNQPSDDMVKQRFSLLEPLSDSTCGG